MRTGGEFPLSRPEIVYEDDDSRRAWMFIFPARCTAGLGLDESGGGESTVSDTVRFALFAITINQSISQSVKLYKAPYVRVNEI